MQKYIALESVCCFDSEDKTNILPKRCKYGADKIGLHCIVQNETNINEFCPYLSSGSAKSSVVLTGEKGSAISGTCYWNDKDLSNEEWEKTEKKWIGEQFEYIKNEA